MFTLYYLPGACSLSPHIVLREAGLEFKILKVDRATKKAEDGADYLAINPKGSVPTLTLEDGQHLTEGPAIVQYIADQVPAKKLVAPAGSMARYRQMEWLNFITSELHKGFTPLFVPELSDDAKAVLRPRLQSRLAWVDQQLEGKAYLMGDDFCVADAYLFVVSNWAQYVNVDITGLKHLDAFRQRMQARPSVQTAMKAEGLL